MNTYSTLHAQCVPQDHTFAHCSSLYSAQNACLVQMFRLLPSHLVTAVLEHLKEFDIGEVFATVPEEYHPQVVQAYFPEVAQKQSLCLRSMLVSAGVLHGCEREATCVHLHILNAVAQIPDMKHLRLELWHEALPVQQFMSSGLQHLSQLSFLQFRGTLPCALPPLVSLRTMKLCCYSPDGLSVPGLMESIATCTALELLQLEGWMRDPLRAGAALAASLVHCTSLHTVDACICSGDIEDNFEPLQSTLFHRGLLQGTARMVHASDQEPHSGCFVQQPPAMKSDQLFLYRLKSLHLSKVVLSCKQDAKAVSDVLTCCTSLQHLKLLGIDVHESQDSVAAVAAHLAPGFLALQSLRTLDISLRSSRVHLARSWMHRLCHDDVISDGSMAALSESFMQLTALVDLQINAQCSASGGRHLAGSLCAMTSLTSLCLEHIPLRRDVLDEEEDDDEEELSLIHI